MKANGAKIWERRLLGVLRLRHNHNQDGSGARDMSMFSMFEVCERPACEPPHNETDAQQWLQHVSTLIV